MTPTTIVYWLAGDGEERLGAFATFDLAMEHAYAEGGTPGVGWTDLPAKRAAFLLARGAEVSW